MNSTETLMLPLSAMEWQLVKRFSLHTHTHDKIYQSVHMFVYIHALHIHTHIQPTQTSSVMHVHIYCMQ